MSLQPAEPVDASIGGRMLNRRSAGAKSRNSAAAILKVDPAGRPELAISRSALTSSMTLPHGYHGAAREAHLAASHHYRDPCPAMVQSLHRSLSEADLLVT